MRIHVLVYTHISSLLCQLKRPRNTKTPDQAREHFQVHPFKMAPSSSLLQLYYWTLGRCYLSCQLVGGEGSILCAIFASPHLT